MLLGCGRVMDGGSATEVEPMAAEASGPNADVEMADGSAQQQQRQEEGGAEQPAEKTDATKQGEEEEEDGEELVDPPCDEAVVKDLLEMGFPENRARRAGR